MSVLSAIGTPFSVVGTATRHAADIDLTFGRASTRYNARDKYRTAYDGKSRYGANVGTALGAIIPAAGLVAWGRRGFKLGALTGVQRGVGVAAGAGALAGMAVVGGIKAKELVEDDGHLGSVGSMVGVAGGMMVGNRLARNVMWKGVPLGPVAGLGAAIAGGVGGYFAGSRVKVGDGHIGEHIESKSKIHDGLPGSAQDFVRGAFNNFNEVGPTTQGVSFGQSWGMRDAFETKSSKAERAGGMLGDLGAVAILGGGALAVAKKAVNLSRGKEGAAAGVFEKIAGNAVLGNHVLNAAAATPYMEQAGVVMSKGKVAAGVAAIAALGAGLTYFNYRDGAKNGNVPTGLAFAGVAAAAGGLATLGIRSHLLKAGVAAGPGTLAGALSGVMLISALSAARMPVQQFINDAKSVHAVDGGGDTGAKLALGGTGAAIGGMMGFNIAKRFADGTTGMKKALILGAGTLVGAGAVGAAGVSMSPLVKNAQTAGIGAGVGAVALGGLGMALTHNVKTAGTWALSGGAVGMVGASMVSHGTPAAPATPGDVAGAATE